MSYDVVIAGGGPAGLSAALMLGRARKRVLLSDAGARRNERAREIHGFVTRDGTPPDEFRRVAREQLSAYPNVEVREQTVVAVSGAAGSFRVELGTQSIAARRVLLCLGMIDELLDLPGYRELWGRAIFQCPYCHGWEVRDRAFGYLAPSAPLVEHALFFQGWSRDLVVFTDARFEVQAEVRARLATAGVRVEERAIRSLVASADGEHLSAVELDDGERVAREVLFSVPPQRQTPLVQSLGLVLDDLGFVRVDERLESSRPGIHAAGDLTSRMQSALLAAAAGATAAHWMNYALTLERVGLAHG